MKARQLIDSVFEIVNFTSELLGVVALGRDEAILQPLETRLFHVFVDIDLANVFALFAIVEIFDSLVFAFDFGFELADAVGERIELLTDGLKRWLGGRAGWSVAVLSVVVLSVIGNRIMVRRSGLFRG